jgi:hypothetical protein
MGLIILIDGIVGELLGTKLQRSMNLRCISISLTSSHCVNAPRWTELQKTMLADMRPVQDHTVTEEYTCISAPNQCVLASHVCRQADLWKISVLCEQKPPAAVSRRIHWAISADPSMFWVIQLSYPLVRWFVLHSLRSLNLCLVFLPY